MTARLRLSFVYKSSYDKANRTGLTGAGAASAWTSGSGHTGGAPRALVGCPVLTDVHEPQALRAGRPRKVDILQIPAFLCRQTDLLVAAAKTGRGGECEEGPVPSPLGHEERGRQDYRLGQRAGPGLRARRLLRLQHPRFRHAQPANHGGRDRLPGGVRRHPLGAAAGRAGLFKRRAAGVRAGAGAAAVAVGVAAVFMETHPAPDEAPSDGPNMVPLDALPALLDRLLAFDALAKNS